jgi:flagellar biosynthesis protein FlhB
LSFDAERTLPPTPRRLAKARERGSSARSACAAAALTLAACATVVIPLGQAVEWWIRVVREAAASATRAPHMSAAELSAAIPQLLSAATPWSVIACAWVGATCAALAAAAACGGVSPAWAALRADGDRISWVKGAKKLATLDGAGAAVALGGAAAVAISGAVVAYAWAGSATQMSDYSAFMAALGGALADVWRRAVPVAMAVGIADIALQRGRIMRGLRMTPREVKEERADNEGRPEIKARRRQAATKRARGLRISAIRSATAVVTNPTHISVALRYDPPEIDVPIVIASGADLMAAVVRGAAEAYGVPVVEAPELARLLYARAQTDGPIPEEAYAAVAAVFAWILRTRGALHRGLAAAIDPEATAT